MKVRLHYWNCRGRAQTLRYILADVSHENCQIEYEETFEPIEKMMTDWVERKSNRQISGPFQTLPVLHVDDREILGQTLSIAHFLGRKCRLYGENQNDDLLESKINGIASCAYNDVIENLFYFLWYKAKVNDPDDPESFRLQRIRQSLQCLNEILSQSSTTFFYDEKRPTIGDFFTFEAFELAKTLHRRFLPEKFDALENLSNVMKNRPALKFLPMKKLTAAPHEDEYLEKISKIE